MDDKEVIWRCIGFDVRAWPWAGPFTLDAGEWETCERALIELRAAFGLGENIYQLTSIPGALELSAVADFVLARDDCDLISVEISEDIVNFLSDHLGKCVQTVGPDWGIFTPLGLDVCDVDGLFSILHNPELMAIRGSRNLFPADGILAALKCAQLCNVIDRRHAPILAARISSVKAGAAAARYAD